MPTTNFPSSLDTWVDKVDNVDTVYAADTNQANDAAIAIETKLGTGSSTPTNDTILYGNGTGTSVWTAPSGIPEISSGWIPSEAATYVSQDGSTGIFNIASDVTAKYSVGMKYKYQQSQALTAYWNFNADSTSQVGSFNGTDTAMSYTAGKFSNAATFNGTTSKIVIADNANLKPTGEFTIGCWFKTSNTGAIKLLFQSFSANTNAAGISLYIDASNHLVFTVGNNTQASNNSILTGTTTVTDNVSHYFVVSYRNNYAQVYLDGKLEMSGYCVTPVYAATNYVRVGCYNVSGSDSLFMNGQIDDLFLINGYALDADTILAQYNLQAAQGTGNITVNKKALITAVGAYSGGNTPITIWGGTDYSLQNATISSPYYATVARPFGFPMNPDKWSVIIQPTGLAQASPGANTWYNLGNSIVVPIGSWSLEFACNTRSYGALTTGNYELTFYTALSTSTSAISDSDLSVYSDYIAYISAFGLEAIVPITRKKNITTSAKTTYYLIASSSVASTQSLGMVGSTIIRAVSTLI